MIQKRGDKLHLLISSLNSSEKGYVNKSLKSSNPKSNLLVLFVHISKMDVYDETKLKVKLKKPVLVKNLPNTKKQLFETILKIIRNYRSEKNDYLILLQLIADIEFLFEKEMVSECEKLIRKGINICDKNEFYGIKIHLLDWKRRILNLNYQQSNIELEIIQLNDNSSSTVNHLKISQDLEHQQLLLHHNIFHHKWSSDQTKVNEILKDLNKAIDDTSSLKNRHKISIADISARIQFHQGNQAKALELLNEYLNQLEGDYYPLTVDNLQRILLVKLGLNILNKDKKVWEKDLETIEALQNKFPILKGIQYSEFIVATYRLQYNYIHGLDYDSDKVKYLEKRLETYSESIPMSSWVSFHLSRYYFSYGKYDEAQVWNIRAINQHKSKSKNFVYICKFHMFMILLELQHYSLIKSSFQELRRYLIRIDRLSDFEKSLIIFFKKAENNWNKTTHNSLLEEFKQITKPYSKEIEDNFFYLDIPNWLKAKEKNMSVAEYKRSLI